MERMLNANEALVILKKHYITEDIQMVSRFIRNGRLIGEIDARKDGWRIKESDLYDFIDKEKPGIVEVMHVYDQYIKDLKVTTNAEEYLKFKSELNQGKVAELLSNLLPAFEFEIKRDIQDFNSPLTKPNDDLKETVEELKGVVNNLIQKGLTLNSDAIDEIVAALKTNNPTEEQSEEEEIGKVSKKKFNKQMSLKEFLESLLENGLIKENTSDRQIQEIYHVYYDEGGKLKSNIYNTEVKQFICPITKVGKNQITYFLREAIPKLINHPAFLAKSSESTAPIHDSNESTEAINNPPSMSQKDIQFQSSQTSIIYQSSIDGVEDKPDLRIPNPIIEVTGTHQEEIEILGVEDVE